MSRKTRKHFYALIAVVLFFALFEAATRIYTHFVPNLPVDIGSGFNPESRLFVPSKSNPEIMVTNPEKSVSFVKQTFSKMKKDGKTIRIVFLGGSSVHFLQPNFPNFEKQLADSLSLCFEKVELINAGGKSFGSKRLLTIAEEIVQYSPDLVLLYSGHNEFQELSQFQKARLESMKPRRFFSRFSLYRFIRDMNIRFRIWAEGMDITSSEKYLYTHEEMANRMANYAMNYELIILSATENNIGIIPGTVPSNLFHYFDKNAKASFATGHFEQARMFSQTNLNNSPGRRQASDHENEIIKSLSKKHNLVLADVEEAVGLAEPHGIPGEKLLLDACHLNEQGNRILLDTYKTAIGTLMKQCINSDPDL